jgi:hypothetical protein
MDLDLNPWERNLRQVARSFAYPPTPDISRQVRRKLAARPKSFLRPARPAWILAVIMLALAALLAVPPVRAAVLEFIQLGAVRIFSQPETLVPSPEPNEGPGDSSSTIIPGSPPIWGGLSGATTLAEAQEKAGFPLRLPAHPTDLGTPDQVFYQDLGGPVVILLWLAEAPPNEVELALFQIGPGVVLGKSAPELVDEALVAGARALWLEGDHLLFLERNGDRDLVTLIVGSKVLVWGQGPLTYRLEGTFTREEAVRIAESMALP